MKPHLPVTLLCCLGAAIGPTMCLAQAPHAASKAPAKSKPAAESRVECTKAVELCVTVPAAWKRLGDVFDELGFVVAEPHEGSDPATWPQLTVASIDVPPAKDGTPRSLDSVVEILLTPDGTFTSAETLQRSHLMIRGAEAEVLKVKLHDEGAKTDSIEEIALIDGGDGLVHSIALRCAPEEIDRLDPVFQRAAHSWHVNEDDDEPAPPAKPKPAPAAPTPGKK